MNNLSLHWLKSQLNIQVLCAVTIVGAGIASPGQAQIIPDNTLGAESSTVEAVILNDMPSEEIQGGAIRDSLLFHSFQEFNIDEGYGAYFFNPDDVSTIFSRVTGNNPSNVLGTLGVLGSADLVFLNPNGVLFGPNSQLDIEGSFTTTTASEIVFPGGEVFSAITPEAPSLIENNLVAPIGLVFEGQSLAPIVSHGNLSAGQNLTLSANTISAQGELSAGNDLTLRAEDTVQIRDTVEQPFMALAGGTLKLIGEQQVDIFALNHPQSVLASGEDMTIQSAAPVIGDAHYAAGGSFRIEDLSGELAPLISEVDPIIATANDVELGGYTGTSLHILAGGQVRVTGDIEITGADAAATSIGPNASAPFNQAIFREIVLSDGETIVSIDGSAQPTLDIRAGIDWETLLGGLPGDVNLFTAVNPNPIFGAATTSADINLEGNVRISAPDGLVYLSNQYFPNSDLRTEEISSNDIDVSSALDKGGTVIIDSRSNFTSSGLTNSESTVNDAGDIILVAQDSISLSNNILTSSTFGTGQGGDITIITDSLFITDGFQVRADTSGTGDAGDITVVASELVSIEGRDNGGFPSALGSMVESGSNINGGNITVTTNSLQMIEGGQIFTRYSGTDNGRAGDIIIAAGEQVLLRGINDNNTFGTGISSKLDSAAFGIGGNIEINTAKLSLTNTGQIITDTSGIGDAGDITIVATDLVSVDGTNTTTIPSLILSSVDPGGIGDSGDILISTDTLSAINGGYIGTQAFSGGQGNAGLLRITDATNIFFRGVNNNGEPSRATSQVRANVVGDSDGIEIITENLSVSDNAFLLSRADGKGDAGAIRLVATGDTIIDRGAIFSDILFGANGNSGGVEIITESLLVSNSSIIRSTIGGEGDAGSVKLIATEDIAIDESSIFSDIFFNAIGNSGGIEIEANSLIVQNSSTLDTSLAGQGSAGPITINVIEDIFFETNSTVFSSVGLNAIGEGNNIEINADSFSLGSGAAILANTFSQGDSGSIFINARKAVSVDGIGDNAPSSIITAVFPGAEGKGGDIQITSPLVSVTSGAQLNTGTFGQGNAGDIIISAQDQVIFDGQALTLLSQEQQSEEVISLYEFAGVEFDPTNFVFISAAFSSAGPGAIGDAGDIDISVPNGSLVVGNGAGITASTSGQGDGGEITIIAGDAITLSGRGLNGVPSLISSNGILDIQNDGGDINLSAMSVSLEDGAFLSVTNFGQGNAGDINIDDTWVVQLGDESALLSQSTSGNGGNINFRNVDLLTLRRGSTVSTEAGVSPEIGSNTTGGGTGGNINADIDFIFAVPSENSDIIANAFDGTGGNIFIVTEGISGLEFRPELTQLSDITASSQFGVDGTVTIDTPGIDFARGFNPLPDEPRGSDITDSCDISDNQDTVELFDIGQGGSIAGPEDTLTIDNFVEAPWLSITPLTNNTADNSHGDYRPNIIQISQDIKISVPGTLPRQLLTTCQQTIRKQKE